MDQHKLSEGDFVHLDFENVGELGLTGRVFILILDLDLSIVVELTSEFQMVVFLNFEVVAGAQWMNESLEPVFVLDDSATAVSE